eukprot:2025833-Rhodomonas_salina.2
MPTPSQKLPVHITFLNGRAPRREHHALARSPQSMTSKLSATKFVPTSWDATFQRNKSMSPAVSKQNQNMSSARQPRRYNRDTSSEQSFSGSESTSLSPSPTPSGRGGKKKEDRMGGLALPDVVRELLKDSSVLRWDARDSVYEVVHGDNFEKRFNDLRKVRNKVKASGTERPFSRMYNFFVLEQGDKWARTGTRFRPRSNVGFPSQEFLAQLKSVESKKNATAGSVNKAARTSSSAVWSSRSAPSTTVKSPVVSPEPSPRVSATTPFSGVRAQTQRTSSVLSVSRPMKPLLKSRRPVGSDVHHASFGNFPTAGELSNGLEVGAIAQTLLGKRGRTEFLLGEPILPADMIEVTARRLRVLDRDESSESRDYYPVRHAPEHHEEHEHEQHSVDFHAAAQEHEEDAQEMHHAEPEHEREEMVEVRGTVGARADMPSPHHAASFDYDDPSDGFSSGQPSPESVISLVADFPGSPLNLDEDEADDDDFS